jgi:L-cysteine S-thiosulfotransferase
MKILFFLITIALVACAPVSHTPKPDLNTGKQIAFSREKGNCLACHAIEDGESPGNIGPALKAVTTRFKTKQQLREQIWDATQFNPETSMPPFGKNKILTTEEIDQVVDYLWGIK